MLWFLAGCLLYYPKEYTCYRPGGKQHVRASVALQDRKFETLDMQSQTANTIRQGCKECTVVNKCTYNVLGGAT